MKIQDRTFIISGGASGLGRATVKLIHQEGGYVSVLDMDDELAEGLVKELGAERTRFFQTDVTDTQSIAAAVKGTLEWVKSTGKELGGVIPAAGVGSPTKIINRDGEPMPLENLDFVLKINLYGVIDLVRQVLPYLTKVEPIKPDGERGVIILVSSSAAFDGQPGQVSYSASKGAIASLTLPLTRDLARYGVRVVTIAPSLFESRMTSVLGEKARKSLERVMEFPVRAGKPEEFAQLAKESITNSMLNGCVLRIDGGMRMPSKM